MSENLVKLVSNLEQGTGGGEMFNAKYGNGKIRKIYMYNKNYINQVDKYMNIPPGYYVKHDPRTIALANENNRNKYVNLANKGFVPMHHNFTGWVRARGHALRKVIINAHKLTGFYFNKEKGYVKRTRPVENTSAGVAARAMERIRAQRERRNEVVHRLFMDWYLRVLSKKFKETQAKNFLKANIEKQAAHLAGVKQNTAARKIQSAWRRHRTPVPERFGKSAQNTLPPGKLFEPRIYARVPSSGNIPLPPSSPRKKFYYYEVHYKNGRTEWFNNNYQHINKPVGRYNNFRPSSNVNKNAGLRFVSWLNPKNKNVARWKMYLRKPIFG